MVNIVIIEDELPARKKLRRFIEATGSTHRIIAEIASVREGLDFFATNDVDLIFSDIELLDGSAFQIYQKIALKCPIIFTTAYDQFWMEAFDGNGIAYLLKPYSKERFQKAWNKFLLLRNAGEASGLIDTINRVIVQKMDEGVFKKRFTVSAANSFYFVETSDILYFEADQGLLFAHDLKGKKHMLNEITLKEIESILDPSLFFRINRSELINKIYIEKIERYDKNTLAIHLKGKESSLKTSQRTTAYFRDWVKK